MFQGEYNHTIDQKGRIIIPNKLRNLLGDSFILTRSFDGCLSIYELDNWKLLEEKLAGLPMTDERARLLKRFLLGSSVLLESDKLGRILIPQNLRKSANLTQDVVFVGVGDHIEIWALDEYTKKNNFDDYANIAKNMEGLGI